jgi:sugar fermentation stimulation protein A
VAAAPVAPLHGSAQVAELVVRDNRYRAQVRLGGEVVAAHVPNPGRMAELMQEGRAVQLVEVRRPERKTAYDLVAVEHAGHWICIDNRLGGRLARLALECRSIPELGSYRGLEAEVRCGRSRLDFRLTDDQRTCWVELKSCTLVDDGLGKFPDAPTVRGKRHVEELAARVAAGDEAALLFLIQRPDAVAIRPHDETDPEFGEALRAAAAAGVRTVAYTSSWSPAGLQLGGPVPVRLA